MFDGLRKKLSDAVKGLIKKEEEKAEQPEAQEAKAVPVQEPAAQRPAPLHVQHMEEKRPEPKEAEHKPAHEEKPNRQEKEPELVKLSLGTKLKGVFSSAITLNEDEIENFAESIRLSLLQSDVSYDTADAFVDDLKGKLKSAKLDRKNIRGELVDEVRGSLFGMLKSTKPAVDLVQTIRERGAAEPVKILFLGPNGTGKTTTMAKIAHRLKEEGLTCIISASDTFRAAAIEQTEHHAQKVGVPVIKSTYGSDPASIAFDAISYAKAHKLNAVLIDTAGRQETNKNLIHEMEKMVRVAKPDITLFVGESTAGNQLSEQIREFAKFMKIDGIILTKLDCDAKGGNAISIAHVTGIPLAYIGTGESYDALVKYTPEFIVNAIMPNS
jgi:fused signal recognition particle receptor